MLGMTRRQYFARTNKTLIMAEFRDITGLCPEEVHRDNVLLAREKPTRLDRPEATFEGKFDSAFPLRSNPAKKMRARNCECRLRL
ncbi:hypothetical protein Zmor_022844 [Zophobas morio]|uniref:Uncharacterized protein n=1 Tax=Zophobas morio TaxID=2755281 RepID=A0AA38HVY0_9CUCU|nr:hypothetical protein Zmor_022844 [Zophobas morio]